MSEPSTTTSLLTVYIHIAAVSAKLDLIDRCYPYMCHIHTLYTPSSCHQEQSMICSFSHNPNTESDGHSSDVFWSFSVTKVHLHPQWHYTISMLIKHCFGHMSPFTKINSTIVIRWPCLDALFWAQSHCFHTLPSCLELNLVHIMTLAPWPLWVSWEKVFSLVKLHPWH